MSKKHMVSAEQIKQAYEKYAPKNITLEQFTQMVEQDPHLQEDIQNETLGNFSTFNVKLARALKELSILKTESRDNFRNLLKDSLEPAAMERGAMEYAKIYEEIICSNPDILMAAWSFELLDTEQIQKLIVDIINAINKRLNINITIDAQYLDKELYRLPTNRFSDAVHDFIQNFLKKYWPSKAKTAIYGGFYRNREKKLVVSRKSSFGDFINTLSHEYGHFIDRRFPNMGMVGSQIMDYGNYVHANSESDGYERYRANPTEVSSFKIGEVVEKHINEVLQERAKKQPEFYIQFLQKIIDKLKVKSAALVFEEKKATEEYFGLRLKLRKEIYSGYSDYSAEERKKISLEIDKDPRVVAARQKYDKYRETLDEKRKEIYPNFYELSDEEQEKIWNQVEQDPRAVKYKKNLEKHLRDYQDAPDEQKNKMWAEWEKVFDDYEKLKFSIRDELYPDFNELPKEQQDAIIAKANEGVDMFTWDDYYDVYNSVLDERYPEFYDLPKEQQQKIWAKVDSKLSVKRAKKRMDRLRSDEYWDLKVVLNKYEASLANFKSYMSGPVQTTTKEL